MSKLEVHYRTGASSAPDCDALLDRLRGAGVDLGIRDRAERVIDDDWVHVRHAERGALDLGFVQELARDDDCGRPSQRFECDAIMRTARGA
jgi:hypothetical protein